MLLSGDVDTVRVLATRHRGVGPLAVDGVVGKHERVGHGLARRLVPAQCEVVTWLLSGRTRQSGQLPATWPLDLTGRRFTKPTASGQLRSKDGYRHAGDQLELSLVDIEISGCVAQESSPAAILRQ
jgi:hypothetical protein